MADKRISELPLAGEIVGTEWVPLNQSGDTFRASATSIAPVRSVNGKQGPVTLTAADVGASPVGHKHPVSDLVDVLPVSQGGTGATDAPGARTALGVPETAADVGAAPAVHTHEVEALTTLGPAGSVPVSDGAGGLTMSPVRFDPSDYAGPAGGVLAVDPLQTAGAKWAKGLGFNARLVTDASWPKPFSVGDHLSLNYHRPGVDSRSASVTIEAGDLVGGLLAADTLASILSRVEGFGAYVTETGLLNVEVKGARHPHGSLSVTSMTGAFSGLFLPFGLASSGSGAKAALYAFADKAAYSISPGETLELGLPDGNATVVFTGAETTISDVRTTVNALTAPRGSGIELVDGSYALVSYSAGADHWFEILATSTALAALGMEAVRRTGDDGAYDVEYADSIQSSGGGGGGGAPLIFTLNTRTKVDWFAFDTELVSELMLPVDDDTGSIVIVSGRPNGTTGGCEVQLWDVVNEEPVASATLPSGAYTMGMAEFIWRPEYAQEHFQFRARLIGDATQCILGVCALVIGAGD